jgi:hypothetical protein
MTGDNQYDRCTARETVADARRQAARAQAQLAEAAVCYADARIAEEPLLLREGRDATGRSRVSLSPMSCR